MALRLGKSWPKQMLDLEQAAGKVPEIIWNGRITSQITRGQGLGCRTEAPPRQTLATEDVPQEGAPQNNILVK
eukprot:6376965-Heterocapsa_arctica.AAC.1